MPVLSLPSCSESDQFIVMMEAIFENLTCDVVAIDGDAMRRKIFNKMMKAMKNRQMRSIRKTTVV